ncbi:MAG: chromosomal replication initiator protein DnaA [Clostridiales bacterium]|nr:chromosomal replication initiator protein DnaA [Clostridiales bacterium]
MDDINKNWERTLEILEPELPDVSFRTWFLPLKFLRVDEKKNCVFLDPGSEMHQSILTNRYLSMLEGSLKIAFGKNYNVMFEFSEDNQKNSDYSIFGKDFTDEFYFNPRYNFSTFVVGNNNKYAHAAAVAVAEAPSEAYNPLFIYGGSGLGKTHLMHAIGHYILQNAPSLKVLYVSSEMFTNELIKALGEHKMVDFKNKYRKLDVLLIDDIQFFEGKESTQEEFFHTFNTLYELNKQIIISSDRAPSKLGNIEERLRSRFQWNLIADISPPDYETRVAILRKKADVENIDVSEDLLSVIELIAEKIKYNIRELEGAFNSVYSFSNIFNEKIDVRLAKTVLKDLLSASDSRITPESIKRCVCKHFNIKLPDIESPKRTKNLAYPRQVAMYLCREMTDCSFPKIGEYFGGRDHTTVLHACDKISKEIKVNDSLKNIINTLIKELTSI